MLGDHDVCTCSTRARTAGLYEKLGAHLLARRRRAVSLVWAPNAQYVAVIGDFNGWDSKAAMPMKAARQLREFGRFKSPTMHREGSFYKFHIASKELNGYTVDKD